MDDKLNHLIQVQDSVLRGINQLATAFISDPKMGEFARKIQPIGSMLSAKLDNGSLANSLSRMLTPSNAPSANTPTTQTPPANNGQGNNAPANNGRANNAPANNGRANNAPANNGRANNGQGNNRRPNNGTANNGNTDYSGTGGRRKTMNKKNKKKRSRRSKH
jgi:hypothetical protein